MPNTVIDVRADPAMLATFAGVLTDLRFESAGISAEGLRQIPNAEVSLARLTTAGEL